jgi:hypothetical protein
VRKHVTGVNCAVLLSPAIPQGGLGTLVRCLKRELCYIPSGTRAVGTVDICPPGNVSLSSAWDTQVLWVHFRDDTRCYHVRLSRALEHFVFEHKLALHQSGCLRKHSLQDGELHDHERLDCVCASSEPLIAVQLRRT